MSRRDNQTWHTFNVVVVVVVVVVLVVVVLVLVVLVVLVAVAIHLLCPRYSIIFIIKVMITS